MKWTKKGGLILLFILFTPLIAAAGNTLGAEVLEALDESIFEVLLLKPAKDSLVYEKPLPVHLIPYAIRKDKYHSIGTAFAVSGNTFLTAAHLFNLDTVSQFKNIYIRNKKGEVYEIDKILKYSDHKDFVLFTIKQSVVQKWLEINGEPVMNEAVFAVGNALGEGIVIRDGVLTSKTLEDENGEWEWLRISAPVSPGNSGGPLLDKDGKIIGLISRKSENENLNYALPMTVISEFQENTAQLHKRVRYVFANTSKTKWATYDYQTRLPKNYHELREELTESYHVFVEKLFREFLSENKNTFFPKGKGSLNLLHSKYACYFPHLISEEDNGNWNLFHPSDIQEVELENNGSLSYGEMKGIFFIELEKPDEVSLEDLSGNTQLLMDTILKGLPFRRTVMNENIRAVSMGKAETKFDHVDRYGRKWLVCIWPIEYNDTKIITFSMFVPGGLISLLMYGSTDDIETGYLLDLKELVNYIYYTYYGTFRDWEEFFHNAHYTPDIFKTVEFSFVENERVSFSSKRFSFNYQQEMQPISADSDLSLQMTYYAENGRIVWDIGRVIVGEHKDNYNYFIIDKELSPVKGLNDSYFSEWEKITNRDFPYNESPYPYEGNTYIHSVHSGNMPVSHNDADTEFIYTIGLCQEGDVVEEKVKNKIAAIASALRVTE